MKKKNLTARLLITVFILVALSAVTSAQDKAKQIDDLMRRYAGNGQFNGTVRVTAGGKVVFKKGYGFANMEWAIPNSTDTRFHSGSITKQFTAMANALKQYEQIRKQPAYYLNEAEINRLGYEQIGFGKIKEAIAVFNINVIAYPQSSNVWDSRGEAYMLDGKKSQAIHDYRKSLELAPYSISAVKKPNELGGQVPDPTAAIVEEKVLDTYNAR